MLNDRLARAGADPAGVAAATVRAHAREDLARELHDELTRRAANVSLQVMGHRETHDVDQLEQALDAISVVTEEMMAHLWLLERVLRSHPDDEVRPIGAALPHLDVGEPVLVVLQREVESLRDAGFEVEVSTPGSPVHVGTLARRTLEQALAAAGRCISERGLPGSTCSFAVAVAPGSVALRVSAVMQAWDPSTDTLGLAALDERVRLVEGTFWVGYAQQPRPDLWSMALRLRDR